MRALLVVNPGSHHHLGPHPRGARQRAGGRAQARGGAHRGTAGHATELARGRRAPTGSTWSSSSAATAPSTRSSTGCSPTVRATTSRRWRSCPAGAPTSSPARSGCPATRSRPPARCSTRCATSVGAASASAWPVDRWFTFNAGMGWDAEVVARVDRRRAGRGRRAGTRRPGDYVRAAFSQFFLHTDRRHPALTLHAARRRAVEGAAPGDRRQHRAVDLPRRPAALSRRPRRPSTPASTSTR